VKKALTSGWLNKYPDVAAATPAETWARSAAVQPGNGAGTGSVGSAFQSAEAKPADAKSMTPLIAPAAILPTITRDVASAKNPIVSSSFQVSETYPHRKP
jgi:hypothetical protein